MSLLRTVGAFTLNALSPPPPSIHCARFSVAEGQNVKQPFASMEKRLLLCTIGMFLLGWSVGTEYSMELYRILSPGMWNVARLTTLLLFSFFAGIPLGCLFASAPIAVIITRRFERWRAQVTINLLVGCVFCFAISRLHPGLVETEFGHEIGYHWFLFSPRPLTELPLAAAACMLFGALALRCADTLFRNRSWRRA